MKISMVNKPRSLKLYFMLVITAFVIVTVYYVATNRPTEAIEEGPLVLVNKEHPLTKNYVPSDLAEAQVTFEAGVMGERRMMKREAAAALQLLFEEAARDGVSLKAISGYRSYSTQSEIYTRRLRETSQEYVDQYIAQPGKSEHQTGYAMDVGYSTEAEVLTTAFGESREYSWLIGHMADFGFIHRYMQGKEQITGYAWEPWHLRYVGIDAAKAITNAGITLEEYLHRKQEQKQ